MQVSIETTSGLERVMTVTLPADDFESQVDARLKEAAKSVRLPGFRPGKVPMKEVRRRFGRGVRMEVAGELMQQAWPAAVQEQDVRPAGAPKLEPTDVEPGSDFRFSATFEVFPEVELADLSGVRVERPVAEVTEGDVDDMIQRLREQAQTFEPRDDRAAEEGDQLTVDFTGYVEDEAFEGGQAEGAEVVLGSGRMIPGFEEALVGVRPGEEKSIDVTFPEEYGNEALAGKPARFDVRVHAVAEPVLPELDEDFFARFGVEEGDLDRFREEVRGNMERELRRAVRTRVKNQVMDALADNHQPPLPHGLVHEEIHRLQHELVQQLGGQGIDPHALPEEPFRDRAERRVRIGLVLNRIVESEELEPDDERVDALLDELASAYGEPDQVKSWYHSNPEQMQQLRASALEDQVVDRVLEQVEVVDEPLSYDEALAAARASEAEASAAGGGDAEDAEEDDAGAGGGADTEAGAGADTREDAGDDAATRSGQNQTGTA